MKWIENFMRKWKPDRSHRRLSAQWSAIRDLGWIVRNSDLRIGQTLCNSTHSVTSHALHSITDEQLAKALKQYRARMEDNWGEKAK